jgi:hypothetical protein
MMPWLGLTLLVFCGGPAFGAWNPLGGDQNAGLTIYADTTAQSDPSEPKTVWILYDFQTEQGKDRQRSYLSVKVQREYDCAQDRRRLLAITQYSDRMGTGEIVFTYTFSPSQWVPASPLETETAAKKLWTLACEEPSEDELE